MQYTSTRRSDSGSLQIYSRIPLRFLIPYKTVYGLVGELRSTPLKTFHERIAMGRRSFSVPVRQNRPGSCPAFLHMLPRTEGRGVVRRLVERWGGDFTVCGYGHNTLGSIEFEAYRRPLRWCWHPPLGIRKFKFISIRDRGKRGQPLDSQRLKHNMGDWSNRAPENRIKYAATSCRNVKTVFSTGVPPF